MTHHNTAHRDHLSAVVFLTALYVFSASVLESAPEVLESDISLEGAVMGEDVPMPDAPRKAPAVAAEPVQESENVLSAEVELPTAGKLKEQEIVQINFLIKQMIEQHEDLEKKRQDLDRELKFIRGQRRLDENRLSTITDEMRKVREQTEQVMSLNQQYSRQVTELRLRLADQEMQSFARIKELEDRVDKGAPVLGALPVQASGAGSEPVIDKAALAAQENKDLMAMIDSINLEGERLKQDTAKVHYNMGNIHFHKREYKKAVEEYKKALKLVPADAAAHFNLAFVSGEYLFDHKTAIKHYREYLLLSPDAPDTPAVRERLLQAELSVRVSIDSPIDTPELRQ